MNNKIEKDKKGKSMVCFFCHVSNNQAFHNVMKFKRARF